jgi:hypothetical protein
VSGVQREKAVQAPVGGRRAAVTGVSALPILTRGDAREQAAIRLAERVTRMAPPTAPRLTGLGMPVAGLAGQGRPLDPAARAYFEPRFARDLGAVRIHADADAATLAREFDAAAFTLGHDIGFAAGLYAPDEPKGRGLLAHELAHVAAQADGPPAIARQPLAEYQTKGVAIDPASLGELAALGYWEQKIRGRFQLAEDLPTQARLENDREEREAVLSVAWGLRPQGTLARESRHLVTIPKRPTVRSSENLVYQINFKPKPSPAGHEIVEVLFVTAGASTAPVTPDAPSTSYRRKAGFTPVDFPQNDAARYFGAHPEEERRVFSWVESRPRGAKFDQVLTMTSGRRSVSFRVAGRKETSSEQISDLFVTFLGETAPSAQSPPAGYAGHDFADPGVEEAQADPDPGKRDRLGAISGLDKVPAGERASAKYAIVQYFRNGTRNAEVDAIVPIVETSLFDEARHAQGLSPARQDLAAEFAQIGVALFRPRRVFFTFRFRPSATAGLTDVEILRIGSEGQGLSLDPLAGLSLGRVNGFAANSKNAQGEDDVERLKKWLHDRYRGIAAQGDTVAAIEQDATAKIRAGVADPRWFKTNYGITILDETGAATRLRAIGHTRAEELSGLSHFSPAELALLEGVLERIGDKLVASFKGLQFIRQSVYFKVIPPAGGMPLRVERHPNVGGVTVGVGANRTIIIFDAAAVNLDALFLGGGARGIEPASALPYAHELGHTAQKLPGLARGKTAKDAFEKLVAAKNLRPVTWYASSDPPKEFFAESFGLYYTDPEWLQRNWPDLYNFFDALDKTGKPPP